MSGKRKASRKAGGIVFGKHTRINGIVMRDTSFKLNDARLFMTEDGVVLMVNEVSGRVTTMLGLASIKDIESIPSREGLAVALDAQSEKLESVSKAMLFLRAVMMLGNRLSNAEYSETVKDIASMTEAENKKPKNDNPLW